jgi:hypothetical protein
MNFCDVQIFCVCAQNEMCEPEIKKEELQSSNV